MSPRLKEIFSIRQWKFARKFAARSKETILDGMQSMGREVNETREMAQLFFRLLESKLNLEQRKEPPTKEEVKNAIEQLKDVGRFSLFTSISLIPGGGFSLLGLELLARKLGIRHFTFVPSAFRKKRNRDKAGPLDEQEIMQRLQNLEQKETGNPTK